jgi:hypothetical protein
MLRSARKYELPLLAQHVTERFPGSEILLDTRLTAATARLAVGFQCVSLFVDDDGSEARRSPSALVFRE